METRKLHTVKIRKNTFQCFFHFIHNYTTVIKASSRCNPRKPKNQKILRMKIFTGEFGFQVNMHVNPTKVNVAKIIKAPLTTEQPSTTTTKTTSTTLPLFNENCELSQDIVFSLS